MVYLDIYEYHRYTYVKHGLFKKKFFFTRKNIFLKKKKCWKLYHRKKSEISSTLFLFTYFITFSFFYTNLYKYLSVMNYKIQQPLPLDRFISLNLSN